MSVPPCVPGLVTVTFTAPAACAGVRAVIDVLLATATLVAAVPPNVTVAPLAKFVPVIVTLVPPAMAPEFGETPLTVAAAVAEPMTNDSDNFAEGLSKLSTVLDAFLAHTVMR